jgi:hypothetical protein
MLFDNTHNGRHDSAPPDERNLQSESNNMGKFWKQSQMAGLPSNFSFLEVGGQASSSQAFIP